MLVYFFLQLDSYELKTAEHLETSVLKQHLGVERNTEWCEGKKTVKHKEARWPNRRLLTLKCL